MSTAPSCSGGWDWCVLSGLCLLCLQLFPKSVIIAAEPHKGKIQHEGGRKWESLLQHRKYEVALKVITAGFWAI